MGVGWSSLSSWPGLVSGSPSRVVISQCFCTPSQKCQPNSAMYEGEHVMRGRVSCPSSVMRSLLCVGAGFGAQGFPVPPWQQILIYSSSKSSGYLPEPRDRRRTKSFLIYRQWFKDFASYEIRVQGSGRVSELYATEDGSLCSQCLLIRASVNDKENRSEDSL